MSKVKAFLLYKDWKFWVEPCPHCLCRDFHTKGCRVDHFKNVLHRINDGCSWDDHSVNSLFWPIKKLW